MACWIAAFVAAGAATNDAEPSWPIYHGDAALRGVTETPLPDKLSVLWRFKAGSPVSLPPVVGGGRIFFVADNGRAYAISLNGEQAWSAQARGGEARSDGQTNDAEKFVTPPLYVRGLLLAGSSKGNLYALDAASGEIKWTHKVGDSLLGSANWLDRGGGRGLVVVAVSQPDGAVHGVDLQTGSLCWTSPPTARCDGSPGVGAGFIAFGNCDAELRALSGCCGSLKARIDLQPLGPVAGGVAVAGDLLFAGTRDGSLVCADANKGKIVWTNRCGAGEAFTTPAVTADRVICGSSDGTVCCLDKAGGKKVWSFTCDGEPLSPVVAGDKVIVAAGGTLFVLKLADGSKVWADKAGDRISQPALAGGRLYIGTDEGFVVCYGAKEK